MGITEFCGIQGLCKLCCQFGFVVCFFLFYFSKKKEFHIYSLNLVLILFCSDGLFLYPARIGWEG